MGGVGVGGAAKKPTLGLTASEQPRASTFRTQPQFPTGQRKPPSSGHRPPLGTHVPLPQLQLTLTSSLFPNTPNSLPPQGLCTHYSTYLRAWHIVGLKKYLVMNEEGKRREDRESISAPASPRELSRDLGRSAVANTVTCPEDSGDRVLVFPASCGQQQ